MHTSTYQHVGGKKHKTQNYKANSAHNGVIAKFSIMGSIPDKAIQLTISGNNARTLEFKQEMLRKPGKVRQEHVKLPPCVKAKLFQMNGKVSRFQHSTVKLVKGMIAGYVEKHPEVLPCVVYLEGEKYKIELNK